MVIEVAAQATRDDVRITLPQFDAGIVVKNSVAYRVDKNGARLIVAVGEDADSLRNKTPAHLHSNLVDLNFVHPFDVEQFKPEFIEAMIRYYIAILMADKRRAHWFRSVFIDRLLLRLSLAGYEKLPLAQRQEFEYGLQKSLTPKVRELIVNGGSSLLPEFIRAKRRFEGQCVIADWVLWALRLLGMLGLFLLLVRVWPDFPVISELLRAFIILVAGLVGAVLGDWLALTIWGIVMPRLLPRSAVCAVVTQASIAKIEKAWLDKLLREPKSVSQNLH